MVEPTTELRKLSPGILFTLVQILEYDESWKRLMAIIPKTLALDNFDCRIAIHNLPKYNTDHFKLIENAGFKLKKPCSEILFEEWGTSGRVRPSLGHLLKLLERAELYRAADYIAVDLLKLPPPERPLTGPAAKVNTSLSSNDEVERLLDQLDYPSSILNTSAVDENDINRNIEPPKLIIPKIVIEEINTTNMSLSVENNNSVMSEDSSLAWREKQLEKRIEKYSPENDEILTDSTELNTDSSVSDMIQFSRSDQHLPPLSSLLNDTETIHESVNYDIPQISELMRTSSGTMPESAEIPAFSQILEESKEMPASSQILDEIPAFSQILDNSNDIPAFSQILDGSKEMPAFSQILENRQNTSPDIHDLNPLISHNNSSELPNLSVLSQQSTPISDLIPNVSLLQQTDKINTADLTNSRKPSLSPVSISRTTTCASPLPNLSLNTILPHFTYHELELCTGGFEETMLSSHHSIYESEPHGRKLGSGAFGSVYLGLGLLDKPVAVKKLNLDGVNVVNVDDTITKQFRNEVELLCKYKHENLLSLLGYSCDGSTYCLVYEYICGGALKDRLQSAANRLIWTNRLYIALGTARAVSYLHNAHSMPLIHRDIKTANILLDNADKPKLCDFGLIKLTPNQNTNTSTTVFGTSAYMAPEAFRGDVSVKLDTFSFGVVLLELLTGLPPLDENREGNDLVTHVEEICEDDIKPLLDTRAGSWTIQNVHFGEELFRIAQHCLEEKKRRPIMIDVVQQLSQLIDKTK